MQLIQTELKLERVAVASRLALRSPGGSRRSAAKTRLALLRYQFWAVPNGSGRARALRPGSGIVDGLNGENHSADSD